MFWWKCSPKIISRGFTRSHWNSLISRVFFSSYILPHPPLKMKQRKRNCAVLTSQEEKKLQKDEKNPCSIFYQKLRKRSDSLELFWARKTFTFWQFLFFSIKDIFIFSWKDFRQFFGHKELKMRYLLLVHGNK